MIIYFSEAEPKGSDCYEVFSTMQECMTKFPALYSKHNGDDDEDDPMKFENIEEAGKSIEKEDADTMAAITNALEKAENKT